MKDILATPQRDVLAQLSWSNVLLGFDFDGTLAPIVADPERAAAPASTRKLLSEVARLYPCVVISGRAARDVEKRLAGIPLRGVIGNHGIEPLAKPGAVRGPARTAVRRWKAALEPVVAGLAGVELEDKGHSLAIHYRRSRRKKQALGALARVLGTLGAMRVVGGKQVLNLLPPGAPHKGIALERERARLGCDTAFFVGDDETDEDVFALDRPGHLLTVRVGASRTSRASYCLKEQSDIDALLARLVELRSEAQPRRRAR